MDAGVESVKVPILTAQFLDIPQALGTSLGKILCTESNHTPIDKQYGKTRETGNC